MRARTPSQQYAMEQSLAKGKAAERSVAHIVGNGIITTTANGQYDDIDVIKRKYDYDLKKWVEVGFSVKDVKAKTKKLGDFAGLPMENFLLNTRTGEKMLGWVHTSKAEWFVFRVWFDNSDKLLFVKKAFVHQWIRANIDRLKRFPLSYEAQKGNQNQGRSFDQSESIIIPLNTIKNEWKLGDDYLLKDFVKITAAEYKA